MAITYEELLQMKKEKKINLPLMRKDLKLIPETIEFDEELILFILANTKPQGILCLTSHRLLYISAKLDMKTLLFGKNVGLNNKSIPLKKVQSISSEQGIIYSSVTVNDGTESFTFDKLTAPETKRFVNEVNKSLSNYSKIEPSSISSVADELIKLKSLVESGFLSQSEFDKKKDELL